MAFFLSSGIRLAYQIDGPDAAPPLILLNSLGTNLHMWDPQVALLGQQVRSIRYDCRGHGASELARSGYQLQDLGNDLLTLLDTLQIEQAHLCGISLGGMIALWFAIHYPRRVKSATFANTAARIGSEQTWDARIAAVRAGGMSAIQEAALNRFLSTAYRQEHPETVQEIGTMLANTSPEGYSAACEALREADLRDEVATIRVPSLILAGELDESTPASQSYELHRAISGSKLHVFPQVAHLSNRERPEEFSQRLLNHMLHSSAQEEK